MSASDDNPRDSATPAGRSAPDCRDVPDALLMQLAGRGDHAAFVALVHKHQNPLLNFFRRLGVYNDAEDLVQDTFVRLFRYRTRYRPTAKFTTFMYLVARQVWIDRLRRKKRLDEATERMLAESALGEGYRQTSVGKTAELEEALLKLPEPMRSVVVLNIYQGLRYDEIASVLKVPVGTVKSRLFNALQRLREAMHADKTR